jgi:hypothetical protein
MIGGSSRRAQLHGEKKPTHTQRNVVVLEEGMGEAHSAEVNINDMLTFMPKCLCSYVKFRFHYCVSI